MLIKVIGLDFFGRKVVKGNGSVHIPTTPGSHQRVIYLYRPLPKSWFTGFFGYFDTGTKDKPQGWVKQGTTAEYINPDKILAKGEGREVTRVESVGKIFVKFCISLKNMKKFGYH